MRQLIFAFGIILLQVPLAPSQPPIKQAPLPIPQAERYWMPTDYTWVATPWLEGDTRYFIIRQNIDAGIKRGEITTQRIEAYETAYQKAPADKAAFFRWAYAAYEGGRKSLPRSTKTKILGSINKILAQMPLPYPREFARLRFIVEASAHPNDKLLPIGEKLLSGDNEDKLVKFHVAHMLSFSRALSDREKAVKYAQDLVNTVPVNPVYYVLLGDNYASLWETNHDPTLPAKAIAQYENYLRSDAPNDEWRTSTASKIKGLQKSKK